MCIILGAATTIANHTFQKLASGDKMRDNILELGGAFGMTDSFFRSCAVLERDSLESGKTHGNALVSTKENTSTSLATVRLIEDLPHPKQALSSSPYWLL